MVGVALLALPLMPADALNPVGQAYRTLAPGLTLLCVVLGAKLLRDGDRDAG